MYNFSKRLLDLISAWVLFLLFLPVFMLAGVLIKLTSQGPIFYKQKRVGENRREFFIYKFRSMVTNADDLLLNDSKFNKQFKKKSGWKIRVDNDPRITKIGRVLRNFSLDELPQIFNILKGEMSMVGPRAYRNDEVGNEIEEQLKLFPKLKKDMEMILTVKPGLTGPWQTSGRNKLSWDKRVKLDAAYARKRSIWYDLWIILKTPLAMLSKW